MALRYFAAITLSLLMVEGLLADVSIVDAWKASYRKPAAGWQQPGFDDSQWKDANGGFGTYDTPGARVGSVWNTANIWLRKSFELTEVPAKPALMIHHDEDAEVFINGVQVGKFEKWTTEYEIVSLSPQQRDALKTGMNLLAVHCRQISGGQFIDVHVIDEENVPTLPRPKRDTNPFKSDLITEWGAGVTAENAWTEYPRPQLSRAMWTNLNGHWDYTITKAEAEDLPEEWSGQILVPFALESKLGGVQRLLDESEALWYHRSFEFEPSSDARQLLNFEAVDYECDVYLNGQHVGWHRGGNDPFTCDVTAALRAGKNELVVRVLDATEKWQLNGKQSVNPRGIWYTQVSGIWQTVWMEEVALTYVSDLTVRTNAADGSITVVPKLAGDGTTNSLRVTVLDGDTKIAQASGTANEFRIVIKDAKLWSPAHPQLYALVIELLDAAGSPIDSVRSYAGIRSVGKVRDRRGDLRFTLNGETIFHWGPLDQGWWPDGLLTPPSDEAMLFDIEFLKSAGFNMIRKHIKVEPRRYYYHCDRLGMLVWQDQVSGGKRPTWTRLKPNPSDAQWPGDAHEQFMLEFERMIDNLENHPSIVVWTPFNEAWGQHQTMEVGAWVSQRDPSRLINIASGGNFWPAGDVVDHHAYPAPDFPFDPERYQPFIKVVGEFGGHGLPIEGHLWDSNRQNWGYGGLPKDKAEYRQRYEATLDKLNELRGRGIAAGVYTQTTDVEGEINGLMSYDRKAIKIPATELKQLHSKLFKPLP